MITVIAQYPDADNEKDGMIQRIAAMDNVMKNQDRIYIDISFRRNWMLKKYIIDEHLIYYRMNVILYWWYIFYVCIKSNVCYVHSIYNSLKIIPIYFFHRRVITDMHGVVVDELKMEKRRIKSLLYGVIEYIVMNRGWMFITVTEEMKKHFCYKYKTKEDSFLNISIFTHHVEDNAEKVHNNNTLVYSGNIQAWQCIDRLLEFIYKTQKKYKWVILSGAKDYFKNKMSSDIVVESVRPSEVYNYYDVSDFGVVLREDNIVNNVACPTKLIEYIANDLIPVVYSPKIGDFYSYGYKYLLQSDIELGRIPSSDTLSEMRKTNKSILTRIMDKNRLNLKALSKILEL